MTEFPKNCSNYTGNCSISVNFCANRSVKAQQELKMTGSALEGSLCAECLVGVAAAQSIGLSIRGSRRIMLKLKADQGRKRQRRAGRAKSVFCSSCVSPDSLYAEGLYVS